MERSIREPRSTPRFPFEERQRFVAEKPLETAETYAKCASGLRFAITAAMRNVIAAVLGIVLGSTSGAAGATAGTAVVERAGDSLSVAFHRVRAADALEALDESAAVVVRGALARPDAVITLSFANEPIERGVRRIMRDLAVTNCAVLRRGGRDGSIEVVVLGSATAASVSAAAATPSPVQVASVDPPPRSSRLSPDDLMERAVTRLGDGRVVGSVDEDTLEYGE